MMLLDANVDNANNVNILKSLFIEGRNVKQTQRYFEITVESALVVVDA